MNSSILREQKKNERLMEEISKGPFVRLMLSLIIDKIIHKLFAANGRIQDVVSFFFYEAYILGIVSPDDPEVIGRTL